MVTITLPIADDRLNYPKRDPRNPMTNAGLAIRFEVLAEPVSSESRRSAVKAALADAETATQVSGLAATLVADNHPGD